MATDNSHLTPRDTPIAAGETAPDFTLMNQDREEVNLKKDLLSKGGPVVLSFYPMDFSSVCSNEMGCFTRDIARFNEKNTTVVGISCDSFYAHKAWADHLKLSIPLLADMHRQVCKAYGFYFAPLNVASRGTVIVGPDQKVQWVSARDLKDAIDNDVLLQAIS